MRSVQCSVQCAACYARAVRSVQCVVCSGSVQCAVCSVQGAVRVQCVVCSRVRGVQVGGVQWWCLVFSVQCACTVFSVQCAVCSARAQCLVFSVKCACTVFSVQCVVNCAMCNRLSAEATSKRFVIEVIRKSLAGH